MLIAIVNGQTVEQVGDYQSLFPNTSFPSSGVDDAFLVANSAKKVNLFKSYDSATQKLVSVAPYVDGEWVYTVDVANLTPEDIANQQAIKAAQNKSQAEAILSATDWTQVADVPLVNKVDFTTYRATVRAIALNPTHDAVFPTAPVEQWSGVAIITPINTTGSTTVIV
jgi:thioesterase domain-containing protein